MFPAPSRGLAPGGINGSRGGNVGGTWRSAKAVCETWREITRVCGSWELGTGGAGAHSAVLPPKSSFKIVNDQG